MKMTKRQLRRIICEATGASTPQVQAVVDQFENFSIDELRELWGIVADVTQQREREIKSDFKKGDHVAFTSREGNAIKGTVAMRGSRHISVKVPGWLQHWKVNPSDLRKI